jgi:hypothetical protein
MLPVPASGCEQGAHIRFMVQRVFAEVIGHQSEREPEVKFKPAVLIYIAPERVPTSAAHSTAAILKGKIMCIQHRVESATSLTQNFARFGHDLSEQRQAAHVPIQSVERPIGGKNRAPRRLKRKAHQA